MASRSCSFPRQHIFFPIEEPVETRTPPILAINDPSSTGHQIIDALEKWYPSVQSLLLVNKSLPAKLRRPQDERRFSDVFPYDPNNLAPVACWLRMRGTNRPIVCAGESAPRTTDALNALLGFHGNDPNTSIWRRDKSALQEHLRKAARPSITHSGASSARAAIKFFERCGGPVVLKHKNGTGGLARVCGSHTEIEHAFIELSAQSHNLLGEAFSGVCCQAFIAGSLEETANAVTCNGRHLFTHLWQYRKQHRRGYAIYDQDLLLDWNSDLARKTIATHAATLDACNYRLGASHGEQKCAPGAGVRFVIEWAGRVEGSLDCDLIERCTGIHPVKMLLLAHIDPQAFLALQHQQTHQLAANGTQLFAEARCVNLKSATRGVFDRLDQRMEDEIRALPTFWSMSLRVSAHEELVETIDLLTSPGSVFLLSAEEDPAARTRALDRDAEVVRSAERSGLYIVRQHLNS